MYAVIEFDDASVEALPTIWLDEVEGEVIAYWPEHLSAARRNKAIEECEERDDSFILHENVRILHSNNSIIIARANAQRAENTSSLETENEELGRGKKRRFIQAPISSDTDDNDEVSKKRSKYPSAPPVHKSVHNKIKEKLNSKSIEITSLNLKKKSYPKYDKSKPSPFPTSNISKKSSTSSSKAKDLPRQSPTSNISKKFSTSSPTAKDLPRQSPDSLSPGISPMKSPSASSPSFSPLSSLDKSLDHQVERAVRSQSLVRRELVYDSLDKESVKKIGHKKIDTKQLSKAEHLTVVSLQVEIRNRLDSMEKLLNYVLRAVRPSQKLIVPKELPSLPLANMDNFEHCEKFITEPANRADTTEFLSKYVSASQSVRECVYILLRKIMTDSLASNFNWKGTGGKKGFSECQLNSVMVGALLDAHKSTPDVLKEAESAVKEWLKYAPKRSRKSSASLSNSSV